MSENENTEAKFEAIDWTTLDIDAVYAFYNAIGRPVQERALLVCPVAKHLREDWRRRCVVDLAAMQKRACPSCAA
jgi:hypothetical protein